MNAELWCTAVPQPRLRINLMKIPDEQKQLADQVNRLCDRIDELLFGSQDFGMVGRRP
jgi:hypothetical protein